MSPERYNLREAYVNTLLELAKTRRDFVVVDADSREATLVDRFARVHPDRSFSFGIAEQDMVSAAAGFAACGYSVFANTYAMFMATRSLDQIINTVAYCNYDVKLAVSHFGLDVGTDGVTHQLVEDLAIFRSVPNMTVLAPADDVEMAWATRQALEIRGPVWLRTGKSKVPRVHEPGQAFRLGTPTVLREGSDLLICAVGVMVERALLAAAELAAQGVQATVLNCSCLKPFDEACLVAHASRCGAVVTVEDHSRMGGLGGLVAEVLARHHPTPVEMVAAPDRFCEAGPPADLFERYGLSVREIVAAARRAQGRKR